MENKELEDNSIENDSSHKILHKKKKRRKIIISGLIILIAVCVGFTIVSHRVYHRSAIATAAEIIIKVANNNEFATEESAKEKLEKLMSEEEKPYELKKRLYVNNADMFYFKQMQVITFGDKETADHTVVYLHGGTYVDQINDFHMMFCDELAGKTNSYVIVPLYPLLPWHTYEETFELLEDFYPVIVENGSFTMIGDSAGGGLAAAFCEYLNNNNMQQPEHLILFSPWVDVSMSLYDHNEYEAVDPMIEEAGTVVMGRAWANGDTKNYLVSPYYGDVKGLTETTIFVGTREILYPDIKAFYYKLRDAGVDVTINIGEGLNHIYPIYPIVPESHEAREIVFKIITG